MTILENLCLKLTPYIFTLLILGCLSYLIRRNDIIFKEQRVSFKVGIHGIRMITIIEIIANVFENSENSISRIMTTFLHIASVFLTPVLLLIIILILNQEIIKKIRILIWPMMIYILICIQTAYRNGVKSIGSDNDVARNPVYIMNFLLVIYSFGVYIHNGASIMKDSDKNEKRYFVNIYVLLLCGILMHMILPAVNIIWWSSAIVLLLYYIYVRELDLTYDRLTKLKNYGSFIKKIEEYVEEPEVTIIVLDVCNLDRINEEYSFLEGEQYILDAVKVIQESFKQKDIYRLSENRFCVVIKHNNILSIQHCITHMKIKQRKYQRKEVPLLIHEEYEPVSFSQESSKEMRLKEIRHSFYVASHRLQNCVYGGVKGCESSIIKDN